MISIHTVFESSPFIFNETGKPLKSLGAIESMKTAHWRKTRHREWCSLFDPESQQTCLNVWVCQPTHVHQPVNTYHWRWGRIGNVHSLNASMTLLAWCCCCQNLRFFLLFRFALRGVFQSLVTKHFPSEKQRREKAPGNKRKRKWAGCICHGIAACGLLNTVPILHLYTVTYEASQLMIRHFPCRWNLTVHRVLIMYL